MRKKSSQMTSAQQKVRDIMTRDVTSIREDATISQLCAMMSQFKLSALPVVDKQGVLAGIVSEKDVIRHEIIRAEPALVDSDLLELVSSMYPDTEEIHTAFSVEFVEEIMTRNVVTISPDASVRKAAQVFCENIFHRIPVVEDGKLVGIISTVDVLRALAN